MLGFVLNWQRAGEYKWASLLEDAAATRAGASVPTHWWVGKQTRIAEGDRVFVLAQGGLSDGLIASGYAAPIPPDAAPLRPGYAVYHGRHFKEGNYITADLQEILTPDDVLPRSILESTYRVSLIDWEHIQLPGGQIKPKGKLKLNLDILPDVEDLWEKHLEQIRFPKAPKDEDERSGYIQFGEEGRYKVRIHKTRERDGAAPRAKKAEAMRMYGKLECEVCNFTFSDKYGSHGADFIECHHREPLALLGPEKTRIIILEELALVCANCHRMLHRNDWPAIEVLRSRLTKSQ